MRAKAAESFCAVCLSRDKESAARTIRTLLRHLQTGRTQGESSVRKSKGVCGDCLAEMSAVSREDKERL